MPHLYKRTRTKPATTDTAVPDVVAGIIQNMSEADTALALALAEATHPSDRLLRILSTAQAMTSSTSDIARICVELTKLVEPQPVKATDEMVQMLRDLNRQDRHVDVLATEEQVALLKSICQRTSE